MRIAVTITNSDKEKDSPVKVALTQVLSAMTTVEIVEDATTADVLITDDGRSILEMLKRDDRLHVIQLCFHPGDALTGLTNALSPFHERFITAGVFNYFALSVAFLAKVQERLAAEQPANAREPQPHKCWDHCWTERRLRILVVDDRYRNLEAAQVQLGSHHEVTVCESYVQAHKLLEAEAAFEVLLCDQQMPGETGGSLGPSGYHRVGIETDAGMMLLFYAALRGVEHIAVVTLTNHHADPLSAMGDWIDRRPLRVNDSIALYMRQGAVRHGGHDVKNWTLALAALMEADPSTAE